MSKMVTPWWKSRHGAPGVSEGSVLPTPILDWETPLVQELMVAGMLHMPPPESELCSRRLLLQRLHQATAALVAPVYALEELQPASCTLRAGKGSCSQRLAVLEAAARGLGIRTRTHGLLLSGEFWFDRFPRLRSQVPNVVVLAWPEFLLPEGWVEVGSLFPDARVEPFNNRGGETLFDVLSTKRVSWSCQEGTPACDLSGFVVADLGYVESRDALFAQYGQTLSWPFRRVLNPVFSHLGAGSTV